MVRPVKIVGTYEISNPNSEQKKIPGIKFACQLEGYINGKEPVISNEHTEYCWQPVEKLNEIEFIPGMVEDIKLALNLK